MGVTQGVGVAVWVTVKDGEFREVPVMVAVGVLSVVGETGLICRLQDQPKKIKTDRERNISFFEKFWLVIGFLLIGTVSRRLILKIIHYKTPNF